MSARSSWRDWCSYSEGLPDWFISVFTAVLWTQCSFVPKNRIPSTFLEVHRSGTTCCCLYVGCSFPQTLERINSIFYELLNLWYEIGAWSETVNFNIYLSLPFCFVCTFALNQFWVVLSTLVTEIFLNKTILLVMYVSDGWLKGIRRHSL